VPEGAGMSMMSAFRLSEWGKEGELVEVPRPRPGSRDVLLKVGGAGACQSDLHLMHDFSAIKATWAPGFVLGHENAGWVAEVGTEVRRFREGDAVVVMGSWGCGTCERCAAGNDPHCEQPHQAAAPRGGGGLGLDGGMAEYMVVRDADRHLVALPESVAPDVAAPLADAGLTPYHAVKRSLAKLVDPRTTALVIGVGGLGGFGVQILSALTAARVVAVDPRAEARSRAEADGASHTFAPDHETASHLRDLTGGRGFDVVLDFVGNQATLDLAGSVVRSLGDLTVVGQGGAHATVGFGVLPYEVSVQTTFWGSLRELAEVVELTARGIIRPQITRYELSDVLTAYRDLAAGEVDGRAVVRP
jgi:propanol-preferring alcohol dehydrogenase